MGGCKLPSRAGTARKETFRSPALNLITATPRRPSWTDIAPRLVPLAGLDELGSETARQWSLVLYSRRVPHRVRQGYPGLRLLVPPSRELEALAELEAFLRENPPEPPTLPDFRAGREAVWRELPGVLWSLGALTVFLTMTGAENTLGVFMKDFHRLGGGDTALMARGEWWRALTALTLHADVAHLVGNVCLGGTFLVLLARQAGLGSAWFLTLAGGVLANAVKVPLQGEGFRFLGASTAVFAALGALAGIRLVRLGRDLSWKRALPFAAGLMILAFLGVGDEEQSRRIDLAGHFMGFGAGFVLGMGYAALTAGMKADGRALSPWLGRAAAVLTVCAWAWALLA